MKISKYLKAVREDPDRKSYYKILKESIHCAILEKEIPNYYFTSLLYKKSAYDYKDFVGHKKIFKIKDEYFYPSGRNDKLENKRKFNSILENNSIPTPKIVGFNTGFKIIIKDERFLIENIQDLNNILIKAIDKSKSKTIFIKPAEGEGGRNSFKFDANNLDEHKVAGLFELLPTIPFIFQETILQHKEINKIYSKSINTIRIHTYRDSKKNSIKIVSALMRFGYGGNVVDNGSSGGMFIPIDFSNWTLTGNANSFLKSGGKTFEFHPDTQFKFDGFELPFKSETINIIKNASYLFENDFIGWDIALSNEGPVIIEGNDGPHMIMAQMACGGLKTHPMYKNIFSDYL